MSRKQTSKLENSAHIMLEQNNVINQIGEQVDSVRDEASVIISQSNIPATVTTQPLTTRQQENQAVSTALAISEARVTQNNNPNPPRRGGGDMDVVEEAELDTEAGAGTVADACLESLEHSQIKTSNSPILMMPKRRHN